MDAQTIYRTFRPYALDLAEKHRVAPETTLVALARAAADCPPNLQHFEIAQYVRAWIEEELVTQGVPGTGSGTRS